MAASPTSRSLQECKRRGWPASVVERHSVFSHKSNDALGFGDILAVDGQPGSLLIQATSGPNVAARRTKIVKDCADNARAWLQAGNRVQVWGYSTRVHRNKDGSKSKVKRWTLRVVDVVLEDFA